MSNIFYHRIHLNIVDICAKYILSSNTFKKHCIFKYNNSRKIFVHMFQQESQNVKLVCSEESQKFIIGSQKRNAGEHVTILKIKVDIVQWCSM